MSRQSEYPNLVISQKDLDNIVHRFTGGGDGWKDFHRELMGFLKPLKEPELEKNIFDRATTPAGQIKFLVYLKEQLNMPFKPSDDVTALMISRIKEAVDSVEGEITQLKCIEQR